MNRISIAVAIACLSFHQVSAGDYLAIFKQRVSENSTPAVVECDSTEVYPGYTKLITSGKPSLEVKTGALIGIVEKKDFTKLDAFAKAYPSLGPTITAIQTRWRSEVMAESQKQLSAEKEFTEKVSTAGEVTTLDGRVFRGIIKDSSAYSISVTTTDGVSSVGIAELAAGDLKRWNNIDRSQDGRFWYERSLAIMKAQEAGINVDGASKEADIHLAECNAYLAQLDKVREAKRKALVSNSSGASNANPRRSDELQTQEDINEMLRMSKLGYVPILDESTGRYIYSPPVDREQQLREAMKAKFLQGR